jgi:hypothetical protein
MNNFLRALPESRGCELEVDNLIESVDPPANATAANGAPARFAPAFVRFQKGNDRFLIGFSEVYWQDITNSYLMGEKKDPPIPVFVWAHSVNARMLKHGRMFHIAREAIDNLEGLLGLARTISLLYKKSGVLVDTLNRFLGDVQMYAESDVIRGRINQRFKDVAARVQQCNKDLSQRFQMSGPPEIYVVAHSEGTVVSYSSLVEAAEAKAPWFDCVRGLVTLGSPIDKHYTIWRKRFRTDDFAGLTRETRVPWFNYWDVSDPVGYGLSVLQSETGHDTDADKLFSIQYDTPFIRYPIPGLAHVGYWTDRDLHRHIIHYAMGLLQPAQDGQVEPLKNRWFGKGHIQDIFDRSAYAFVRLATIAVIGFFVVKLLQSLAGLGEIKNTLGYAMGLGVGLLIWNLHTKVHKGLVQMWRYTKGAGTSARIDRFKTAQAATGSSPK